MLTENKTNPAIVSGYLVTQAHRHKGHLPWHVMDGVSSVLTRQTVPMCIRRAAAGQPMGEGDIVSGVSLMAGLGGNVPMQGDRND
jgi:hypothetical protein